MGVKVWLRIWKDDELIREVPIVYQPTSGWAAKLDGITYTALTKGQAEVLKTMVYLHLCKGLTEEGKKALVDALNAVFEGRAQHFAAWDWRIGSPGGNKGWDWPPVPKEVWERASQVR